MFAACLYNVADGIFIGQGVGSAALGEVNIAVSHGITLKAPLIFCLPPGFGAEAIRLAVIFFTRYACQTLYSMI